MSEQPEPGPAAGPSGRAGEPAPVRGGSGRRAVMLGAAAGTAGAAVSLAAGTGVAQAAEPGQGSFKIKLSKAASGDLPVGWFVLGQP